MSTDEFTEILDAYAQLHQTMIIVEALQWIAIVLLAVPLFVHAYQRRKR